MTKITWAKICVFLIQIRAPLVVLFLALSLQIFHLYNLLPSLRELTEILKTFFDSYGLVVIGPASFIENLIGINSYFPGSIVILTAMSLTAGQPVKGVATFAVIYVSAVLAYNLNFVIGRANRINIETSTGEGRLYPRRKVLLWFMSTFWHPQFASLTSFTAGVKNMNFRSYFWYMIFASLFWNSFWALLMYHVGFMVTESLDFTPLIFVYIVAWLGWEILSYIRQSSKSEPLGESSNLNHL